MKLIRYATILLVVILCIGSAAQAQKTVKLAYQYNPGQIDKYKMVLDMKLTGLPPIPNAPQGPLSFNMSAIMRQKVLGVLPDGSAKVSISYSNFDLNIPGMNIPKEKLNLDKVSDTSVILKVGKNGQMLGMQVVDPKSKTAGVDGTKFSHLMSQLGYYGTFPKWDLEVGSQWMQPIPLPFGCEPIKVISTLEAAALPYGNYNAARINQTFEGRIDLRQFMSGISECIGCELPKEASSLFSQIAGQLTLNGAGSTYFSPDRGKLLKVDGSANVVLDLAMPQQLIQQGAPSSLNLGLEMNIEMTKI